MTIPFIKEIQHFSVGDGSGIRSTVFFRGCNLKCKWCHNPELIAIPEKVAATSENAEQEKDYVISELLSDRAYYVESGGGVTYSGGEPMLYTDFLLEVMPVLKKEGVHQIIDTAGCVEYGLFEKVMPFTDRFFYDLKCLDKAGYERHVGGDFDTVFDNLKRLVKDAAVTVRIPVIPKVNDSPEQVARMAEVLRAAGATDIDLLPFHRLGSAKYKLIGQKYDYAEVAGMTTEEIMKVKKLYKSCGLKVRVEQ